MIPYYPEPVFRAGIFTIHVFSLLLVAAVLWGGHVMIKRAVRLGIAKDLMFQVALWAITCGLVGADIAKLAIDFHSMFATHPFVMFTTSRGIRSLGGLVGGLLGVILYCSIKRVPFLETFRILDVMAYALPFAFLIGRLGCALVHDHRGLASASWIAVKFPGGSRYDLGLIEFLFLIPMSAAFLWLDRTPRATGFFLGLYGIVYGLFRMWLNTLQTEPVPPYGLIGVAIGIAAGSIAAASGEARKMPLKDAAA